MATRTGKRRREPLRAAPDPASAPDDVVDLRDDSIDDATPLDPLELQAQLRARAARAEAERELMRLRARHWSGERLIEEGCIEAEWWEHPDADPYAVLGLLPGSPIQAAAAARRQTALRCHPDTVDLQGAERELALRRMVAANAAYDRLRRALHPV